MKEGIRRRFERKRDEVVGGIGWILCADDRGQHKVLGKMSFSSAYKRE